MSSVYCQDIQGNIVAVPSTALTYRPAVYGILIEHGQVLLLRHAKTGLWHPPGTVLNLRETPTGAIRQHFRQVTGMMPSLGPLLHIEDKCLIDEENCALQLSVLYYALERPDIMAAPLTELGDDVRPELVSLDSLQRELMQFGYEAVRAGRLRLGL